MTDEQKEKKRKLLSDRQLRSLQGYDPNPPLCGNCKRFVKPLAGDNMSPFCWLRGLNVSSVAVCDFWLGHQGAALEDAPCQKNLPCKKPGDGVDEGVFLERLKENLRNLPAMLAAAPAAPEQQEPTSPCACRPGMMCNRSAACADEIRRDAQASNAQQAEAQEPFGFVWLEDGEWQLGTAFNGGPPLNAKAVFTRPQPAQRPPLTVAEVEAILARWSYELHGDRARFIVRETELAHGIG